MSKVTSHISMSLDGFITDPKAPASLGAVDVKMIVRGYNGPKS